MSRRGRFRAPLAVLLILGLLLGSGCRSLTPQERRAELHGSPLSHAEVVQLATEPAPGEGLALEARTRGLAFDLTAESQAALRQQGVSQEQVETLVRIASDPDPFGDTPRKDNTPLIVVGVVAVAAVLTGIGFLVAELIDEDDRTVIIHDGHTYIEVRD